MNYAPFLKRSGTCMLPALLVKLFPCPLGAGMSVRLSLGICILLLILGVPGIRWSASMRKPEMSLYFGEIICRL